MDNGIAISQTYISSSLLKYYHQILPPGLIYGIGQGYPFMLDDIKRQPPCEHIAVNFFSNLLFFINHFVTDSGESFLNEINTMLYVKHYPLGILFSDKENTQKLLTKGNSKTKTFWIYDGKNKKYELTGDDLRNNIAERSVDFYVLIPPRRMANIGTSAVLALRSIVSELQYINDSSHNKDKMSMQMRIQSYAHSSDNSNNDRLAINFFADYLHYIYSTFKIPDFDYLSQEFKKISDILENYQNQQTENLPCEIYDEVKDLNQALCKTVNQYF